MEYAICTVPAAPVRKEPNHRAEMVNQLLFGETMQVLETKDEWFRIKSTYDDYEGWLTNHLISEMDKETALSDAGFVTTERDNLLMHGAEAIYLPMGSSLVGFDEAKNLLWDKSYQYHGNYRNTAKSFDSELLRKIIQGWMNTPYMWGGKTFMGVDCSGFVQTVFKVLGIKIRRDAYQQAEQGIAIENLQEAKPGDLAFFQNENSKVTHVGILLKPNKIIHASGRVRIDTIDEEGIMNVDTGKRTHRFHSMRRYF